MKLCNNCVNFVMAATGNRPYAETFPVGSEPEVVSDDLCQNWAHAALNAKV